MNSLHVNTVSLCEAPLSTKYCICMCVSDVIKEKSLLFKLGIDLRLEIQYQQSRSVCVECVQMLMELLLNIVSCSVY